MMVEPSDYKEYNSVDDMPTGLKEYPFVYDGMSIEKYCEERNYYATHWSDVLSGKYIPIWKQNGEKHTQ